MGKLVSVKPAYYWDTCIFVAHLTADKASYGDHLADISQFLSEASSGECEIHCSTITIAEITRHNAGVETNYADFEALWGGGIIPISPDTNTMRLASELRSIVYKKTGGERKLDTADAIHLASALTLIDTYEVEIAGFHTFDRGKKRGLDGGKGVPLIDIASWLTDAANDPLAQRLIDLSPSLPNHPNKKLFTDG